MAADSPPICDYEGSDYQERFWEAGERAYEDRVESIALDRLVPKNGRLMLELGAGAGRNTPRYSGFERVALVDYSRTQLQAAQARLGRSDRYVYVAADVYRLPFRPTVFDAATLIRTLHHLADPQRALAQVRGVLQPGATFVLEYANKHNLKAILRYALRKQTWSPFSLEPIEFATLNFDFHPRSVCAWLESCGFSVERQLTVSHFRVGALKRLVPLNLLARLDALAQLTGNWWQLSPSVFVRSRAVGERSSTSAGGKISPQANYPQGDNLFTPPAGLFKCPACEHSPLEEGQGSVDCSNCGRRWPVEGGIYDFRVK
jgi:SAM-dependent methyltransferase